MNKNIILAITAVVLVAGGFTALAIYNSNGPIIDLNQNILFYGQGCPHCKNVDDFMVQNKVEDKIKILKLEVWYNKGNQKVLKKVVQKCGITSNQVGVPFFWNGKTCIVGDQDIINYFKNLK